MSCRTSRLYPLRLVAKCDIADTIAGAQFFARWRHLRNTPSSITGALQAGHTVGFDTSTDCGAYALQCPISRELRRCCDVWKNSAAYLDIFAAYLAYIDSGSPADRYSRKVDGLQYRQWFNFCPYATLAISRRAKQWSPPAQEI